VNDMRSMAQETEIDNENKTIKTARHFSRVNMALASLPFLF